MLQCTPTNNEAMLIEAREALDFATGRIRDAAANLLAAGNRGWKAAPVRPSRLLRPANGDRVSVIVDGNTIAATVLASHDRGVLVELDEEHRTVRGRIFGASWSAVGLLVADHAAA